MWGAPPSRRGAGLPIIALKPVFLTEIISQSEGTLCQSVTTRSASDSIFRSVGLRNFQTLFFSHFVLSESYNQSFSVKSYTKNMKSNQTAFCIHVCPLIKYPAGWTHCMWAVLAMVWWVSKTGGGQANDTFTHDTCREEDTDPAPQTSRNSLFRILSLQLVTGTECLMYCWWPDYTRLAVTWPHLVWWPG